MAIKTSYSRARENLATLWGEVAYLLRSPANATRLRSALTRARRGRTKPIDLMEAVLREPFAGIGKPEQLKHLGDTV